MVGIDFKIVNGGTKQKKIFEGKPATGYATKLYHTLSSTTAFGISWTATH